MPTAENDGADLRTVLAKLDTMQGYLSEVKKDQREERDARVALAARTDALEKRDTLILSKIDKMAIDDAERTGATRLTMWVASMLGPTGIATLAAALYHLFSHP